MANQLIINPIYKALKTHLEMLPTTFDKGGELLYAGRNVIKRFVWRDPAGRDCTVVVKRYAPMRWLQKLCYSTFFASKAKRAYLYAFELQKHGIDTPTPIAYLEVKRHVLLQRCFLVTSECNLPDCTFLRNNAQAIAQSPSLLQALAAFIVKLHTEGILHGDLNLSNILYQQQADGTWHFAVIDINRTRFENQPSQRQCLANLVRLTHDRVLLHDLVSRYAALRGWSPEECSTRVLMQLNAFERRRELRHALFKRKKSH